MAKYLWGVIALLTLACSLLLSKYADQVAALSKQSEAVMRLQYEQKQANMRREKDLSTLVAREADRRSTGLKLARAEQALSEALERNKTWSDTNVPTDIQDRILGLSDGPAEPVGGVSDLTPGSASN